MADSSAWSFDPEVYKRWWAENAPGGVEYGECWCGCGGQTSLASQSSTKGRYVNGEPYRYLPGHHWNSPEPNPEQGCNQNGGYCECGCGNLAPIIPQTVRNLGLIEGRRYKRIAVHVNSYDSAQRAQIASEYRRRWEEQAPNIPFGYCWCGCGQQTKLAANGKTKTGHAFGQPMRYVRGHHMGLRGRPRQYSEVERKALRARYRAQRRARERDAHGSYTVAEVRQMLHDQGDLCAYCECELVGDWHVDHMTPLCRGGSNDWSNLAVTCSNCNQRKYTKTAEEFMTLLC